MRILGNRPKTLVYQSSLFTEVPPYPTALATLGMEGEVHQKFLHYFLLVCIETRQQIEAMLVRHIFIRQAG
ncbi:MAG TPA: hypothetical protein DDZ04_08580 [Parabacteroides sp.]|nr:hypothetical protein [Parabacteroides sp.]